MRSIFALTALVASVAAQSTQDLATTLAGDSDLSTLTSLVKGIPGLVDSLSSATNITILAPSNAAFAKFLNSTSANTTLANMDLVSAILSYHILNGTINSTNITSTPSFVPTHLTSELLSNVTGGQRVEALNNSGTVQIISGLLSTSNVTKADIGYNNGIIHVIDTILTPPANISDTAEEFNLTSVAGALTAADLVDTIDSTKDLTVFAPSNAAFQEIASLLSNATMDTLVSVLKYHVIAGSVVYSTDITQNISVASLGGTNLSITVSNGTIYVDQAKVIIPNVLVANGVVHVIDSVLNPGNATAAPGNGSAFGNASSASDVPFTSGVPGPTGSATVPSVVASATSSSTAAAAIVAAMPTGIIGAGMLFAGALMAL